MGEAKPWQIVLIIVAFLGLAVSLYFSVFRSTGPNVDSSLTMADVNTGEIFHLPIGKGPNAADIPGKNPKTGEKTLMPVMEENGKWVVLQRFFPSVKNIPGGHPAIDDATREVKVQKP
jgi:hypothetical protein